MSATGRSKPEKLAAAKCRPLFTQERTQVRHRAMSETCQEETHALQQTASLCLVRHRDFTRHLLAPSIDPQQHDNDGAHQRATREQ